MSEAKILARKMRLERKSLNFLIKELGQPKTTVWGWIRDILLTEEQKSRIYSFGADRCKVASQKKATEAMLAKYAALREVAKGKIWKVAIRRVYYRSTIQAPLV